MRSNKVYGRIQNESTYPAQFVSLKALGKIVYLNFEIFFLHEYNYVRDCSCYYSYIRLILH